MDENVRNDKNDVAEKSHKKESSTQADTKKIRICHVISDGKVGGAGVLLCNLLSALDREKFHSAVVVSRHSQLVARLKRTGVRVIEGDFAPDRSLSLRGMLTVRSCLLRERYDVVHTHGAAFGRVAAKSVGTLAVNTRHCDTKMKTSFYNLITDFTVATSQNMFDSMKSIPAQKRLFIPNGSAKQPRLDVNERLQMRHRLGIPSDAVVVGFVGRLEKIKGCDVFLRAAAQANETESLYFVVVGDGSERRELLRLTRELSLSGRVKLCPYTENVWEYMNVFDIGVNSSLGSETCPLAISEMMSLGIPIVASDIPGNAYMLKGPSGVLFKTGDERELCLALQTLARDKEKRQLYSREAVKRYKSEFSLDATVKKYESLYARLCGRFSWL